jgi:hypothetical protein
MLKTSTPPASFFRFIARYEAENGDHSFTAVIPGKQNTQPGAPWPSGSFEIPHSAAIA